MAEQTGRPQRHYGIDLLRMLSMYFVLILHIQLRGGVLENSTGAVYWMAQLLEHLALVAVNCFALISGYVGVYSKPKLSRLLLMWVQAFFYGLCYLVIAKAAGILDADMALSLLLPVSYGEQWYLQAYFGLWFFIPLLNLAVQQFSLMQYLGTSAGMFVLFSLLPSVTGGDPEILGNSGYSTIWLILLYWFGAGLRKYVTVPKKARGWCLLCWLLLNVFCILRGLGSGLFAMAYSDALNFAASVALFLAFTTIEVRNKRLCGIIRKVVPGLFAVYLLHTYLPAWDWLHGRFIPFANLNPLLYYPAVLGTAAVIFVLSVSIDLLRLFIERKLRIRELPEKAGQKLTEELTAWAAKKNIFLK